MGIAVYIPTPFRRATNNKDRVSVDARDVRGLLDELEGRYSGLKGLVRNEAGEIHDHVNVYVNNEGIESLQGLQTSLKDGDEVSIIPALAGGGGRPSPGGGPVLAGGGPALVWG
jgi:molybdopterin synthase sulfur carrier subunit